MDDPNALKEELKHFMSRFPQGVALVTTHSGKRMIGVTISSFTSLSLDPPLVYHERTFTTIREATAG